MFPWYQDSVSICFPSFWRPLGHKSSRLEYLSWEELVPTEDLQKALLIYPEHWQDLEPWLVTMDNTPVTIVCKGTVSHLPRTLAGPGALAGHHGQHSSHHRMQGNGESSTQNTGRTWIPGWSPWTTLQSPSYARERWVIYPEHWQDLEPWLVTMDNTPVTIVCKGTVSHLPRTLAGPGALAGHHGQHSSHHRMQGNGESSTQNTGRTWSPGWSPWTTLQSPSYARARWVIYPEHWQDLEPWLATLDNTPHCLQGHGESSTQNTGRTWIPGWLPWTTPHIVCKGTVSHLPRTLAGPGSLAGHLGQHAT